MAGIWFCWDVACSGGLGVIQREIPSRQCPWGWFGSEIWAGDREVEIRNIKPLKPWEWASSHRDTVKGIGSSPRTEPAERTSIGEVQRGSGTCKRKNFHRGYNGSEGKKHLTEEEASNPGWGDWGFRRLRASHWFASTEVINGFKEKDFNGAGEEKVK